MLFGEPGAGKSVLAMQIADALARGKAIDHFQMPSGPKARRKVLYVDLVLTDRQFAARYGKYRFSASLYRETPAEDEHLLNWVRAMITEHDYKVVVIDDLSMVSRTDDGTRETLELMRGLRRLTAEAGVSVLVLADSFPLRHSREVSESDLRRSRVLCGVADSVFAIGFGNNKERRNVAQMRSRSGELMWTVSRPATCFVDRLENGLLGMDFALAEVDEDRKRRIREVREMHDDEKKSFREIAVELEISKTTAQRLYAEWRPEYGRQEARDGRQEYKAEPEPIFWRDEIDQNVDYEKFYRENPEMEEHPERWTLELLSKYRFDPEIPLVTTDDWDERCLIYDLEQLYKDDPGLPDDLDDIPQTILDKYRFDPEPGGSCESGESGAPEEGVARTWDEAIANYIESGESLEVETDDDHASVIDVEATVSDTPRALTRQVTDLERSTDGYGKEIFIEKWDDNRRRPTIWYKRERDGFRRFERGTWGIDIKRVDGSVIAI